MNPVTIYQKLLKHFGRQYWWPAETRFEIMVGAILTQQTTWRSVESAIANLKKRGLLALDTLAKAPVSDVEICIRQTGFFRQKTRRLISLSKYIMATYDGSLDKLFDQPKELLHKELLSLKGVGSETADSIMLYAADKLTFPIDAYTTRVCQRLGVKELKYESLQKVFENQLPQDLDTYKEFHALMDKLGKTYCRSKPQCASCPLVLECSYRMRSNMN